VDRDRQSLVETSRMVKEPLVHLPDSAIRPPREALDKLMSALICCD
jgi:hypothetical protein